MNDYAPSTSVIIPTFNRAESVGEAIESVLRQSHPPHQVIVVDDGSTDDTAKVLASFGAAIETISQNNAGVSAARNAGCTKATGEWLTFLDSDDVWNEDRLAILMRDIRSCPVPFVAHVGDVRFTGADYSVTLFEERGVEMPTGSAAFREDPLDLATSGLSAITAAVRRTAFCAMGGFDQTLAIYEDLNLFCRLALKGPFLFTGDVVAHARRLDHDKSSLTSLQRSRPEFARENLAQAYAKLLQEEMSTAQRKRLASSLSGALHSLAEAQWPSDKAKAIATLAKAARVHPNAAKGCLKSLLPVMIGWSRFRAWQPEANAIDRS